MATPLVSVLLCNYNHGKYLRQCLAGLQGQSYRNLQIAITDDGSTDGSQDIIRELAAKDPRIEPNFFPSNRGVKAAFSDSLSRTRGTYLYSGASDDFVLNMDFFKKAVQCLENDSRPAGFYGITGIYIAELEQLSGAMGTAEVLGYNTPLQCCEGLLKYRSVVTSPSCVWRRQLFLDHGGKDMESLVDKLGPQTDYCLNHELAWTYGMHYEKTPFACQRVFQAKTNFSANMNIFALASHLWEMEKRLRAVGVSYPDIEKDWLRWRAVNLLDSIKKSGVQV